MTTKSLKRPKKSDPARPAKPRVRRPSAKPPARTGGIIIDGHIRIPAWVVDHASFRQWACSDDLPEGGQFSFINGEVYVDLSMETVDHNQIKTIITIVIGSIVMNEFMGRFFADRMLLTHEAASLSNEPDAMFVSFDRFANGLVILKKGGTSKELIGSPNMALEVISKSSVRKDRDELMMKYAEAGVDEYWLVDSTIETPVLEIHRLTSGKYVSARSHDGWVKSHVFGRSFRLISQTSADEVVQFALETK